MGGGGGVLSGSSLWLLCWRGCLYRHRVRGRIGKVFDRSDENVHDYHDGEK